MIQRRKTRRINVGSVPVGDGAKVPIQSMTNTDTCNGSETIAQVCSLAQNGCDIVRVAVPDMEAVNALPEIIKNSPVPIIADIHFDHRLALGAIEAGIAGIRINPGNIGGNDAVKAVAKAAGKAGISIRVGSNSGSIKEDLLNQKIQDGIPKEDAMADVLIESALEQCNLLESVGFKDIKVSLKASDVAVSLKAYRKFAAETDYPLHLGITEAGTLMRGTVKSAVGIGTLLLEGIGDTIRVSLTADPVEESKVGVMLLESVGLRSPKPEIVSCPTCGRTEINLFTLTEKVENLIEDIKSSGQKLDLKKIAVMGCIVNGPGESRDAELGIAGGKGKVVLFKSGRPIGTYDESEGFDRFSDEIMKYIVKE